MAGPLYHNILFLVIRPKIALPRGGRRAGGIDIIVVDIEQSGTVRVVGYGIANIAHSRIESTGWGHGGDGSHYQE